MRKKIVKLIVKILSNRQVQEFLLETAENLSKKTKFTWDDDIVAQFKRIWERRYYR